MKFLVDEYNTQERRVKHVERENDILTQQHVLKSRKLVFIINYT
jgi:hypothetical protein